MNLLISRQTTTTFSNIKAGVENQTKRQFKLSHLQQILQVTPFMYNHKWEMKMGKMEAIISVPKNIESVLGDP